MIGKPHIVISSATSPGGAYKRKVTLALVALNHRYRRLHQGLNLLHPLVLYKLTIAHGYQEFRIVLIICYSHDLI
jgi:hypothetical protein